MQRSAVFAFLRFRYIVTVASNYLVLESRMGKWTRVEVITSILILGWDVCAAYFLWGLGGDCVGLLYCPQSLERLGLPPLVAERLHTVWYVLTTYTLQNAYVYLMSSALLVLGTLSGDLMLRIPWILSQVAGLYTLAALVTITWLVLFLNLSLLDMADAGLVLAGMLLLFVRILVWQHVSWRTLNDVMRELTVLMIASRFRESPYDEGQTDTARIWGVER